MPRLFFALWPDDAVRHALAAHCDAIAREAQGRATRADTLHLTLVFIGNVDDSRVSTLLACGDRVRARAFSLSVNRRAGFARARVAWLGGSDLPPELGMLHGELRAQVENAGFALHSEPLQPHITIARHCKAFPDESGIAAIDWRVESFVLVHSLPTPGGPLYRVLKHWTLAP
jgi:2'-5' RNA ligase